MQIALHILIIFSLMRIPTYRIPIGRTSREDASMTACCSLIRSKMSAGALSAALSPLLPDTLHGQIHVTVHCGHMAWTALFVHRKLIIMIHSSTIIYNGQVFPLLLVSAHCQLHHKRKTRYTSTDFLQKERKTDCFSYLGSSITSSSAVPASAASPALRDTCPRRTL